MDSSHARRSTAPRCCSESKHTERRRSKIFPRRMEMVNGAVSCADAERFADCLGDKFFRQYDRIFEIFSLGKIGRNGGRKRATGSMCVARANTCGAQDAESVAVEEQIVG